MGESYATIIAHLPANIKARKAKFARGYVRI